MGLVFKKVVLRPYNYKTLARRTLQIASSLCQWWVQILFTVEVCGSLGDRDVSQDQKKHFGLFCALSYVITRITIIVWSL